MKYLAKISIGLLILIALVFGFLALTNCKSKKYYDPEFMKYYNSINDTIVGEMMARELSRFEKQSIQTTFQVIGIEHKEGYNIVVFQYKYDGNFLGGSVELYLHSDSIIPFRMGRGYYLDFIPERGGEPIGAPND